MVKHFVGLSRVINKYIQVQLVIKELLELHQEKKHQFMNYKKFMKLKINMFNK